MKCEHGPYNVAMILFAFDPAQPAAARLLRFPAPDENRKEEWQQYRLTFPEYDPKAKRLHSFHKSRGLGDCGSAGEWRWTGKEFRLNGYWITKNCDGRLFDASKLNRWRVFPPKR